jgi:hypothetical protein
MAASACSRQPKPVEASQAAPTVAVAAHLAPAPPATSSPALSVTPQAQPASRPVPELVASDQTQGPFHIGGQDFTFVKHVQGINGKTSGDDSTVEWWELRDSAGNAVYRRQYPVDFQNGTLDETESVDARQLKANLGEGILVEGGELPSAPDGGWWVQVFGLINGNLTTMSGALRTDGPFLGEQVEKYQPRPMPGGQQQQAISHDVLKFRIWTGNVSIIYGVMIDWIQGKVRPEWTCTTAQGQPAGCRYPIKADPAPRKDLTFVRLFPEPESGFTPKHVVVKPDSKIEYIEAQASVSWSTGQDDVNFGVTDPGNIWLHVKIDGQDGWISGEEDFEAVGLPQAG